MTTKAMNTSEDRIVYGNEFYNVELNPGLEPWEIKEAEDILRWLKGGGQFFGIAGLMLVTGMPRQGKGLFANVLLYKIKRYFKGQRILRDDIPKPLFGTDYTLFNEDVLLDDVSKMAQVAKGEIPKEVKTEKQKLTLEKQIDKWRTEKGEVMMQNGVMGLDEFWRYMNNRRPMSPMNLALSGIIKMWGHMDLLLIGIAQRQHDLDRYTCLPYTTHEVRCKWCTTKKDTVEAHLYRVQFSVAKGALVPISRPVRLFINGSRLRPELGNMCYFDLYNSKSAPMFSFKNKFSI